MIWMGPHGNALQGEQIVGRRPEGCLTKLWGKHEFWWTLQLIHVLHFNIICVPSKACYTSIQVKYKSEISFNEVYQRIRMHFYFNRTRNDLADTLEQLKAKIDPAATDQEKQDCPTSPSMEKEGVKGKTRWKIISIQGCKHHRHWEERVSHSIHTSGQPLWFSSGWFWIVNV